MLRSVVYLTDDHVHIRAFAKTLADDVKKSKDQKSLEENVYKARHLADLVLDLLDSQDYSDSSVRRIEEHTKLAEAAYNAVKYTTELVGKPKSNRKKTRAGSGWYRSWNAEKKKKTKTRHMHNPWLWKQVHAPKPAFVAPWAEKKKPKTPFFLKGSRATRAIKKKTPFFMKKSNDDDVVIVSDSMEAKRKTRVTPKAGNLNYWDQFQGGGHHISADMGHKFTVDWRKTRKSQRKKKLPEVIVIDDDDL